MFKEVEEYEKLKKNEDIIWYFKVKDSDKFDILKHREITFSDEFDKEKLDTKKWLTNYYWGEKLLKDRYSVEPDLQFYTEKENFELGNSFLKIITKPQKIDGKVWSAAMDSAQKNLDILPELSIQEKVSDRNMVFFLLRSSLETQMPNVRSGFLPIK